MFIERIKYLLILCSIALLIAIFIGVRIFLMVDRIPHPFTMGEKYALAYVEGEPVVFMYCGHDADGEVSWYRFNEYECDTASHGDVFITNHEMLIYVTNNNEVQKVLALQGPLPIISRSHILPLPSGGMYARTDASTPIHDILATYAYEEFVFVGHVLYDRETKALLPY